MTRTRWANCSAGRSRWLGALVVSVGTVGVPPGAVPFPAGCADKTGMRRTSVALVVLTAGLTASAAVRRVLARRRAAGSSAPAPIETPAEPRVVPTAIRAAATVSATTVERPASADDAVVLPFPRRAGSAPAAAQPLSAAQPQSAARCGDTGGRTKAGAPCAARATGSGRCHHHRVAA